MKKTLRQQGFAALEAVLLVVIVAILVFTGWFVWHAKQNTDKSLAAASKSTPAIPQKSTTKVTTFAECKASAGSIMQESYPETCVAKSGQRFTDTSPQSSSTQYLTIKEWGVRMMLVPNLSDAYYEIFPDRPDSAYLSLQSLAAVAPDCAPDKISIGALYRQTVAEHQSATQSPADSNPPGNIRIGDYYYGFLKAQAGCFDESNAAANTLLANKQPVSDFTAAELTLQAVPTSN